MDIEDVRMVNDRCTHFADFSMFCVLQILQIAKDFSRFLWVFLDVALFERFVEPQEQKVGEKLCGHCVKSYVLQKLFLEPKKDAILHRFKEDLHGCHKCNLKNVW